MTELTTTETEALNEEGWHWPSQSRKAHYFVNGQSLCRNWGWIGPLPPPTDQKLGDKPGPDDCRACWRNAMKRVLGDPSLATIARLLRGEISKEKTNG